jgi:hypothetical protein
MKSVLDLDKMSKAEIHDHRVEFLSSGDIFKDSKDNRQYLWEVELYIHVRFKQDVYDQHERWVKQYQANPEKNRDLRMIVEILTDPKREGADSLYYMHTMHELQKIGKFKFIMIPNVEVPEKYRDMKFHSTK